MVRKFTVRPIALLSSLLLLAAPVAAQEAPVPAATPLAEPAGLRVTCFGDSEGVEVFVNGVSKGDCPFMMQIAPGMVKVRAARKVDDMHEQLFEREVKVVSGVGKTVEIELSPVQLTAEGAAIQRDIDAKAAALAEAARQAKERDARARADAETDMLLTQRRARFGTASSPCPDCPAGLASNPKVRVVVPPIGDAQAAAMAQAVAQDALTFLATNGASFRPPAEAAALPCPAAEAAIRKLVNFVDLADLPPDLLALQLKVYSKSTTPLQLYYRDVKIWPVRAACADGKLDGPLDAWILGNFVMSYGKGMDYENTSVTTKLYHVRTTLADGKPSGELALDSRTSTTLKYYRNPTDQAIFGGPADETDMAWFTRLLDPGPRRKGATVHFTRWSDPKVQKISGNAAVVVDLPQSDGSLKSWTFEGGELTNISQQKGNDTSVWLYRKGSVFSTSCWRGAEQISSSPCS